MAFFILRGLKEWGKKKKKKCGGFSNRKPKINPIRRNNKKNKKGTSDFLWRGIIYFQNLDRRLLCDVDTRRLNANQQQTVVMPLIFFRFRLS
jgi:hypothetical protein